MITLIIVFDKEKPLSSVFNRLQSELIFLNRGSSAQVYFLESTTRPKCIYDVCETPIVFSLFFPCVPVLRPVKVIPYLRP